MRTIALYGTVAAIITAALFLFSTTGGPAFAAEKYSTLRNAQRLHPQPRPQEPVGPSVSHSQSHGPPANTAWDFDVRRDRQNFGLTEEQCSIAFPDLYKEVDRAVKHRKEEAGPIQPDELDVGWRGDGIVRAMIHDNQLYIIDAHGVWDHNHRPRSLATLQALSRAVSASQEKLPTIEFTLTDHDSALVRDDGNHTTWAYARMEKQESLWLMPDFGFWGWPDVGLRSYSELQATLEQEEDEFIDKVPKLVWRGSMNVGSGHDAREGLLKHASDQPWSDVQTLDWKNKTDITSKLLTMEDHCQYMFTAQTEGNTYSGRLKFLLNCHSALLSHELHWIEHYHHLLRSSGPEQNYIKLARDFSDLPKTMKRLLKPQNIVEEAGRVAANAHRTFRDRYLTPAAEACYWRALIRGWASVQGFEPQVWVESDAVEDWRGGKRAKRKFRGAPFESYVIMGRTEWEIPAKPRKLCVDGG